MEGIFDTSDQTVEIRIELDEDEDPLPETSTDRHELRFTEAERTSSRE